MTRVGMFVWNSFINDARVHREATTLSENGFDVDLICLFDEDVPGLLKTERINAHFCVHRITQMPFFLRPLNALKKRFKRQKLYLVPFIMLCLLFMSFFLVPTLILLLLGGILMLENTQKWILKACPIIKMTIKGYIGHYDIYHANDLNTMPQAYVCSKWRFNEKKWIYDSHEVQTSRTGYKSPIYKKIENFFIKRIDEMFVENHTRAKYNAELYGNYPHVLHNYPMTISENTVEVVPLKERLGLREEEKILLYQGGIQEGRGLEQLIEAFPLFSEGTLVFIGDGRIKEALKEKVKRLGQTKKIKFIDKVPHQELPGYTRNAYLGFQVLNNVCFNHYSASSNKLFEYIMNEVPVIASDLPEIKKVVIENKIGEIVDAHDPKDIARAVNKLLKDVKLRNAYSASCISARKRYNWEGEQKYLLDVYNTYKKGV